MTDYLNEDMAWSNGAPDLGRAFPSLAQQIKEYPPLESSVSDNAYSLENIGSNKGINKSSDSDFKLIISGASYHVGAKQYTDKDTGNKVEFNGINLGLGLQRQITDNISIVGGIYDNSYSETSLYGLVSWESDPLTDIGHLTAGIDAGIVSGYKGYVDEKLLLGDTGVAVIVSPFVAVDISDGADWIPEGTDIKANFIPAGDSMKLDGSAISMSARVPF